MDKFKDLYNPGPNYTRLFLLFFLFLGSIYYYFSLEENQNIIPVSSQYVQGFSTFSGVENPLVSDTGDYEENK